MKDSDLKINKIEDLIKKDLYKKYNVFKSKSFKFGGWSVEKDFAKFLGTLIKKFKFENIVELGSGVSTLILAKELKNKKVKIFSIDHFQGYQNKVCEELERCNFNYINFRTIKIRITYLLGKFFFFYNIKKFLKREIGKIDLLIIDGPPYYYRSREAALYAFDDILSENAIIILDDANRMNQERVYIKNWQKIYGENIFVKIYEKQFKKGLAVVQFRKSKKHGTFSSIDKLKNYFFTISYIFKYLGSLFKIKFLRKI